jgi:hypothetical protein
MYIPQRIQTKLGNIADAGVQFHLIWIEVDVIVEHAIVDEFMTVLLNLPWHVTLTVPFTLIQPTRSLYLQLEKLSYITLEHVVLVCCVLICSV